MDILATLAQKEVLKTLLPERVQATDLAGEPITTRITRAPGNDAPLGGIKVVTENGWSPPGHPAPKPSPSSTNTWPKSRVKPRPSSRLPIVRPGSDLI